MEENSQKKPLDSLEQTEQSNPQQEQRSMPTNPAIPSPPIQFRDAPDLVDALYLLGAMRQKKYCATELLPGQVAISWFRNKQYGETKYLGKYHLDQKLKEMGEYQLNGVLDNNVYRVFDVIDLSDNRYLSCMDVHKFCEDIGIMTVPMLSCGYRFSYSLADMDGKSRHMPQKMKGIVYRTMKPEWILKNRLGFKLLNVYYEGKK